MTGLAKCHNGILSSVALVFFFIMVNLAFAGSVADIFETPIPLLFVLSPACYFLDSVMISGKPISEPEQKIQSVYCPGWGWLILAIIIG